MNVDEIVEQFGVTPEQVKVALDFAVRSLDVPVRSR
jgi:uncharacterized protein (DUF433 family)